MENWSKEWQEEVGTKASFKLNGIDCLFMICSHKIYIFQKFNINAATTIKLRKRFAFE